jgi:hypothetical protein
MHDFNHDMYTYYETPIIALRLLLLWIGIVPDQIRIYMEFLADFKMTGAFQRGAGRVSGRAVPASDRSGRGT